MKLSLPMLFILVQLSAAVCFSQAKMTYKIARIEKDFSVQELSHELWQRADEISIEKYWSGEDAPRGRHAKAKILWSPLALYVRFEANQTEPLVVSEKPNLKTKTKGLWDRDVCEIFVAPDKAQKNKYFEFEIAPNGEWIDLKIYQKIGERITDWDYASGMQTAAKIEEDKVFMAIKIQWKAFGKTPQAGDVWVGNLFRCVGAGETRGYLAWSPTETEKPNFHVPEKFGEFEFIERLKKQCKAETWAARERA
jgi:alpha-galactosidase